MLFTTEAALIRSMDYGEGNKIITLYSPNYGKVSVMARGAKRVKSRHTAVTQLFTQAVYTYYKAGKMGTLNHADILFSYDELRNDIVKTAYASYLCEMVFRLVHENDDGSAHLYQQLTSAFDAIASDKDPQIVSHIFEFTMLHHAGYAPILERCALCQRTEDLQFFNAESGGMICSHCVKQLKFGALRIEERTWKLLRLLQQVRLDQLGNINVSDEGKLKLKQTLDSFLDVHVEPKYWNTRKFLQQMQKHF